MAYIGFDANEVEERTPPSGSLLPVGMYDATITRVKFDDTKSGGKRFEVEFDINSPAAYNRRKFWDNFNLINSNQTTVRIAKEQLADLVKAVGLLKLEEDEELIGKQCSLYIRVQESKNPQYPDPKNVCGKYWPVGTTQAQHDEWLRGKSSKASQTVGGPTQASKPSWGAPSQGSTNAMQASTPIPAKAPWAK